jgi:tetratricopeptide (TPR) repeat protein
MRNDIQDNRANGGLSAQERINNLVVDFFIARREMKRVKNNIERQALKEYLDDLKLEIGWTFLDCGEYEKALALFNSLPWKTHGEMKCNGLVRVLTEIGQFDEATGLIKRGLRIYPNSYALWIAKGALHESQGDHFESLECIEKGLQFAQEDNSVGLCNKALVLVRLGSYEEALPIFDQLVHRHPNDPKYLSDKAACLMDMGYPQKALPNYQKALEIWQQSPDIYTGICLHTGLCSTYLKLGMKREAMDIALEGLKKFPDEDPYLYQNLGAAFWNMGWRTETIEVLRKGIEKFPEDEELRKFLKDVDDDTDDPDGGEKPPLLGLILLIAILRKRLGRK